VRANNDHIKKFLTISLIGTYLFIILTYIVFLPKQQSLFARDFISALSFSHPPAVHQITGSSAQGPKVLIHRAYKSTLENKYGFTGLLILSFALLLSLIIFESVLPALSEFFDKRLRFSFYNPYLSFCSLRI
jgi:hypothetical protein